MTTSNLTGPSFLIKKEGPVRISIHYTISSFAMSSFKTFFILAFIADFIPIFI
ncbi:hypothetical protein [Alkalihalobacillus trypoxylicola]|uniref:hypothetical protein n=1 Tax=Alkalihalobacillus trypoxylicola TaxID=519424 RepID=UPI000AF4BFB9|nr:hypothetical protein [Alkalihalobacillus trypoxylicola]